MKTNHQMNYYDYAKTLSAEGVMTVIGGGVSPEPGPEPEPEPELPNGATITFFDTAGTITLRLDSELPEGYELGNLILEDSGGTKYDVSVIWNTSDNITYTSGTGHNLDLIMRFELEIKHNGTVSKTINVRR